MRHAGWAGIQPRPETDSGSATTRGERLDISPTISLPSCSARRSELTPNLAPRMKIMRYLFEHPDRVLQLTIQHVQLVAISTLLAMLIGIPVGILVTRIRWLEGPVINTTGVLYTVPSLALFAMLIPFTGLGLSTAVVALVVYSLLAIVRNTVAGIDAVPYG